MSESAGVSAPAVASTDASGADTSAAAAPVAPRMVKLMLDGKEMDLPESEVVGKYKRGGEAAKLLTEAQKRKEEALRAKAEADGLLSRFKKSPSEARAALRELGIDLDKLSEEHLLEQIKREQMTPEQRQLHELQQKLKGHDDEKAKAEDEKKQAAHQADVDRHMSQLGGLFTEAMALAGLPKSAAPAVFPRMAQLYAQNEKAGLESTPEEMAHHAMSGLRDTHTSIISRLDGDELLDFVGPEGLRKVLAANLKRSNARRGAVPVVQPAPRPASNARPSVAATEPKRGSPSFFRELQEGRIPQK